MTDVTQILSAIESGDPTASEQLLPLVYEELRLLAKQRLANENPGHTLQATALVHEAYLRLLGTDNDQSWDGRGHFFAAAAEAMRRILIDNARKKGRIRRGGDRQRIELEDKDLAVSTPNDELLLINDAIDRLAAEDSQAASLVKLRYFLGFSMDEAAQSLQISSATAYRHWTYARAWLRNDIQENAEHKKN